MKSKQTLKWKYSRGDLACAVSHGIKDKNQFIEDILAKSTPKKKSKEIKQEDKKECHCGKNGHALNSINCPIHGKSPSLLNDIETIEELNKRIYFGDFKDFAQILNKLIKNQRIHTQILNLLIKKNNGKRIK